MTEMTVEQRAFAATRAFNGLKIQLRGFARAITGNDEVEVMPTGSNPRTDGTTIWLRPPLSLADTLDHGNRADCGKRDATTEQMLCESCARQDDILGVLMHELAHIAFDSFESMRDKDIIEIIGKAIEERGENKSGTREAKLTARLEDYAKSRYGVTYAGAARLVSPFLHPIINGLEDARVNRAMYTARSGTRYMFSAKVKQVFAKGIEANDGTHVQWRDQPENSQVIVGLYVKASGFDYKGWFSPAVEDALNDPTLTRIVARLASARSVASVYRLAFPVLEQLRALGFCKMPDDVENDPAPKPQPPTPPPAPENDDDPGQGDETDDDDDTPSQGQQGDDDDEQAPGQDDDDETDDDEQAPGQGDDDDETDDDAAPASDDDFDDDDFEGDEDGSADAESDDDAGMATQTDDDGTDSDEYEKGGSQSSGERGDDDDAEGEGDDGFGDDDDDADDEAGDEAFTASGDPTDALDALKTFGGHEEQDTNYEEDEAIDLAVSQGDDFDSASPNVQGVNVHDFDKHLIAASGADRTATTGWRPQSLSPSEYAKWDVPEALLSRSLFKMRQTFQANRRSKTNTGQRSGSKIVGRHLSRVALGDDRVFGRRVMPGKKDYFVVISLDISGSTDSSLGSGYRRGGPLRIDLIKQAAMAQAELLHRCGVKFAVYAHSGDYGDIPGKLAVDVFPVKEERDPWDNAARDRLRRLTSTSANLDGHMLEFLRKRTERSTATDRIVMYFTDGEMPAMNNSEETEVLVREIKTCKAKGITLVGVGVCTDSPRRHGLDTIQIDAIEDLPKLVGELEKRLV